MSASLSRRDLLGWMAAASGAAVATGGLTNPAMAAARAPGALPRSGASAARRPRAGARRAIADPAKRVLVVVEMPGGNDGMSTVVPFGLPGYYDLRKQTAIAAGDVLKIDEQVGLHPNLKRVHEHGVAVVHGVGSSKPDGSHFEMMRRWWAGDAQDSARYDTGWVGRVADVAGDPAAAASAVSVGAASHPIVRAKKAATLALPNAESAKSIADTTDDKMRIAFQQGIRAMAGGAASAGSGTFTPATAAYLDHVRATMSTTIGFAEKLRDLGDVAKGYPDGDLAKGLAFVRQLVSLDFGVRVAHIAMPGDFDTHEHHNDRHPQLMATFDTAIGAFLDDLAANGLDDRVLVMTTSEFGRTAVENGSAGLDHGTASNHLLIGPVNAGRFGVHPDLTERDDNNDLIATMQLEQYLGTVVQGWLGIPAAEVFTGGPAMVDGIFA